MTTTQAYSTFIIIGSVILFGYIFVSSANFVEPHRNRLEELDSADSPANANREILKKLESPVLQKSKAKSKAAEHDEVDPNKNFRSRRSSGSVIKTIDNEVKSFDQNRESKSSNNQNRDLKSIDSQSKKEESLNFGDLKPKMKIFQPIDRQKSGEKGLKNMVKKLKIRRKKRRRRGRVIRKSKLVKAFREEKKQKSNIIKVKPMPEQILSEEEKNLLQIKLQRSFGAEYQSSPDYKRIVSKCSEYRKHKGRILFFDSSQYLETQPNLCDGEVDILLAVHTRPEKFERRDLIRNTFGSMRYIRGKRIALAFFLGAAKDSKSMSKVSEEARNYQDIVQRNFIDHYRNMTYKHLTVMDWVMEFCPKAKHLVKIDDDVFANMFQIVDYIDTFNPQTFYCTRTIGPKPMRKKGKWRLTYDEYSKPKFPPYCMGYAYIMKASLAKDLYWCSVYSKFLWIDDVHVGGTLPKKLRLKLEKFISGHNSAYLLPSHGSWKVADHMFLLGTRNELLPDVVRKIWRASLQFSY